MSDTGLIVTNAHVVSSARPVSGRQQLKVQMHNGDVYEATIKDIDKKSDIATIKVNPLVRGVSQDWGQFCFNSSQFRKYTEIPNPIGIERLFTF